MPEIHVLDKQVAELIAAGEVIDRPASVIKELVENCIDAQASVVTVEIKNGGITYMRVTDNGCGIRRADVSKAFLRHATSKVRQRGDLEAIGSLGFRGEALASIAAMCRVEILTRTPQEQTGVRYRIEGGVELGADDAGCPPGTTIVVRDIFYNTPARMKFLKRDATEAAAVAAVVEKAALSHPEISFKFIRDGELKMQTPGSSDLLATVYAVLGRAFSATLQPVEYTHQGLRVCGFISRPTECRANRTMQNFFINGRYVRSRTCAAALEEAYKHAVMVGKFPAAVLQLQIPAGGVDVNVHPTKLEVRFAQEKDIFDLVYYGVKSALSALDAQGVPVHLNTPAPAETANRREAPLRMSAAEYQKQIAGQNRAVELRQPDYTGAGMQLPRTQTGEKPDVVFVKPVRPQAAEAPRSNEPPYRTQPPAAFGPARRLEPLPPRSVQADTPAPQPEPVASAQPECPQQTVLPQPEPVAPVQQQESRQQTVLPQHAGRFANARLIGELFGTYILLQTEERLILIDKHAAHERLLFEQLRAEQTGIDRQTLLSPVVVTLSRQEHQTLLEQPEALTQIGVLAEDFGGSQVIVREIPVMLELSDVEAVVCETAHKLLENHHDLTPQALDDLLHSIACRAAVKAHDFSTPQELEALIRLLEEHEEVRFCPHGRPIATVITKTQIEKMFGRV